MEVTELEKKLVYTISTYFPIHPHEILFIYKKTESIDKTLLVLKSACESGLKYSEILDSL